MIHDKLFSSFRSTDTIFHMDLFISFINFITCSYFSSKLLSPKLLLFIFLIIPTHSRSSPRILSPHREGRINEEWLAADCLTALTHFTPVPASRCPAFFSNIAIILMANAQGRPSVTPVYLSTLVEHSEYISILYLCTGVFCLKCLALQLFPLNFTILIQNTFPNWSK